MKLFSWNINGYQTCNRYNGLLEILSESPDFVCLQETKISDPTQLETLFTVQYEKYYNFSFNRKGHNGVYVYAKYPAINVINELGCDYFDKDGRFLCLEYSQFFLINIYIPHGGRDKKNIIYKLETYQSLHEFLNELVKRGKKIIVVGDFNVACDDLDVDRYKYNSENIMFTEEERKVFKDILSLGFKDVFRENNPKERKYTWWPYAFNARERNIGWRIDYCLVYGFLEETLLLNIRKDILGSDHCPLELIF